MDGAFDMSQSLDTSSVSYLHVLNSFAMEEEDVSTAPDSPTIETPDLSREQATIVKQRASLQTYLSALPYNAESEEDMHARLEFILGRIIICAEAKNWLVLATWDGVLQCWLLMRYPVPVRIRAKLARLYYELCILPGIEPRLIRSWADMFSRLLAGKSDARRKLEPEDLQLPWKPLWRVLQRELWPRTRFQDPSRNVVNIFLYLAERSRCYYPAGDIPEMLEAFIPLITQEAYLTMIPVMTSFLPPTHIHLYLPTLFKIWEAFNSTLLDDRLIEFAGELSEEHVAGTMGKAGEDGGAQWKDVGIWSETEWTVLMGKALGSMNVPVGAIRGASTTGAYADSKTSTLRIRKAINRFSSLAKLMVYSMAVDAPVRSEASPSPGDKRFPSRQVGYLAGSKAMESLDKFITSTESFFHPSNSGMWSLSLTQFLRSLTSEFCKRWHEEELPSCKTPLTHRLTAAIRRAFVLTLRTPALLAMFSKDPLSMGLAQGALRSLAFLEPALVMPDLLERAYSGLEVVNETHRTTAVLSMLASVSLPLSSETIWLGGQKHILPLLEMCIPGIDLNDPAKTICATMFIIAVVQNIKIGDLSSTQLGLLFSSDAPGESMDVDEEIRLPDGTELGGLPTLSKGEERTLVRESTAGFADWVTSLFRRVLSLYENLPEEGGKKNTTGGRQEESVIKSIKSMLDLVCLHLSDPLFDLVLKLVYDYVTANAKSNAVKAIGQMISSLALAHPSKTIDKFLPFCLSQIKDELKHGASSVRTTSSHVAIPSDTTLHWNMSILRGCFGHDGTALLKHKTDIMELLCLLADKTFSERGYSGTGRLIQRVLNTLVGVYPLNARFVNTDVWDSEGFDRDHNSVWGKLHRVEDVKIEWHVPSDEEISFILHILTHVVSPALDKVEALLPIASSWDGIARNDFCRHLHIVRSAWQGLPTLCKEPSKTIAEMGLNANSEVERLVVQTIDVDAAFALIDPSDQRHQLAYSQRLRLGRVLHGAALALKLKQEHEGEDHIDAVMSVVKGIDAYLLDYALSRGDFDNLQKSYATARELNRAWARQKENSRLVHLKRALVYHSGRVYMHALYRRRSELDNHLIKDLVNLSLSPYTRVRRHAQAVLGNVCGYYVRSTKLILPSVFDALAKGSDPDRMKGALYILWSKGLAVYAIADPKDPDLYGRYLLALLECQHQEKPSIQKLVTSVAHDAIANLAEETTRTDAYLENAPQTKMIVDALKAELSAGLIDDDLLSEALHKSITRSEARERKYSQTISAIADIALRPTTHWRYTHLALQFLNGLLRRDVAPPSDVARLFINHTISPHPPLRGTAQKGVIKLMNMIKMRTYSRTSNDLWLDEWRSPIAKYVPITSDPDFHAYISRVPSIEDEAYYIDKQVSGFLVWAPETKTYTPVPAGDAPITWESSSESPFVAIGEVVGQSEYFEKLMALWGQESSRNVTSPELRTDNVAFIKTIAKMSQGAGFENILNSAEKLLWDTDRFKQRAGAEMLAGVTRGAKNWPKQHFDQLWSWIISRLDRIYASIKPDTIGFWEATFTALFEGRDPRRVPALSDWILSLPLDFYSDSAFATIKTLKILGCFLDYVGYRDVPLLDRYFPLLLGGTDVSFAEIRVSISGNLHMIATRRWRPNYPSVDNFLRSVATTDDPLFIRRVQYLSHVEALASKLSDWKEERLPPPRVNQSTYDKVGLSLLRWLWIAFYNPEAPFMFPYMLPLLPEIFRMSELSDNPELQTHSQAVLYILSAVAPPPESIEAITDSFVRAIRSSTSWRIRLNSLPTLVVFFYRNLMGISDATVSKIMDLMLNCLSDDNVEVREMASSALSGIVRVSQRQSIIPLKDHFVSLAREIRLPTRRDPGYAESLRTLHSSILGLCALIESFPYSVEKWLPPLTDILAVHATDPPPISTTIRKMASEFKKTHQDTWHRDQLAFDEDQLQNLSTMLVGTSYYA